MFKHIALLFLIPGLVFATCQMPQEPEGNNYAELFEYGQELAITANCYFEEGNEVKAEEYYLTSASNLELALEKLKPGTDFELRGSAYKKLGNIYSKLSNLNPSEPNYAEQSALYYKKAEMEFNKTPDYWMYIIIGVALIVIILIGIFMFKKKEYPDEYVKYTPSKRHDEGQEKINRPMKKGLQQSEPKPEKPKKKIKEKYKNKLREKYGL